MTKKRTRKIDLNPSSADRWTTCTASPQFIFDNWDRCEDSDNVFNQEGTTAHEVAAAFLQDRKPDESDKEKCPVPVNAEMRMHGWDYSEYVASLREPGSTLLVEHKFPLFYMEGRNAIVDAAVVNQNNVHIVDFKYGEGIIVDAVRNLQLSIYAIGLILSRFSETGNLDDGPSSDFAITLHIFQPRGRDSAEPFRTWETTWGELYHTGYFLVQQAHVAQGKAPGEVEFAPSEKACQWCPAKKFCESRWSYYTKDVEALAVIDEKPLSLPAPNVISVEQIVAVLKHGSSIEKWIKDVESYALSFVKNGGTIPGHKLVLSRGGNRFWSDPDKAGKLLLQTTILREDEVYEKKVIGPAAAEKKLGKQKFNVALTNLISKAQGTPVLAPEDDKREAYVINASDEFGPIIDLDEF
jgi:hypothetical protein